MLSLVLVLVVFSMRYIREAEQSAEESVQVTLQSLASLVESNLDELSQITFLPYINTDIMRSLNSVGTDASAAKSQYELNETLERSFKEYLQVSGNGILDLMLITEDGSQYFYSKVTAYCDTTYPYQQQAWYLDAMEANGKAVYVGAHNQDYIYFDQGRDVFSVARVIKKLNTREPIAIILVDSEAKNLQNILTGTDLGEDILFTIVDGNDQVICSEREMTETETNVITSYAMGENYSRRYQVKECAVGDTGWRIISLNASYGIFYSGWDTYVFLVVTILLYLGLNQVMFHLLSNRTLMPLQNLAVTMKQVQDGDLSVRYQIQSEDEVGDLGRTFNNMLDQIQVLIEQKRQSGILLKKAEYSALQSQIEPHFIYNVLSNFAGLNSMGERELLEHSIQELAQFLRYMLNHADEVTLSVEIDMLEKYCSLLKLRFGDRLETIFSCDETFRKVLIPKLLLQPLIENSVIHGIEPSDEGGYVSIICEAVEKNLIITVEDNGVGFDMEGINLENSVGIRNVRDRLLLFYRNASFSVSGKKGMGTVAKIVIPMGELKYEDLDCRR
jgi:two-component system sensor histidine kinase YesM